MENHKLMHVKKILLAVYQEWGKVITPELIALWADALKGHRISLAYLAAKYLVRQKSYGEPKLGDFMEVLGRIEKASKPIAQYNPHAEPGALDRQMRLFLKDVTGKVKTIPGGKAQAYLN